MHNVMGIIILKCYHICHEFHDETTRLHFCFITLNENVSMQNISRLYTLDSNEHFMHSGYEIISCCFIMKFMTYVITF
jgi:hypothetical protein